MRDPRDEILGLLSLDNPRSGNRPDDAEYARLEEIDAFVNVVGKVAENRFWARRLRESEEVYRQVFDAVMDGLFINDLEGRIVQVNPAGCRMHGYERDELMGESCLKLVPPEQADLFARVLEEVSQERQVHTEATSLRKDGTTFDCEVYASGFQFQGRPHLLVVLRDITERKQVFQRLLDDQKDESVVGVAGGVAHDFNNLLMGMTGPLSLLRRDLPPGSDAERHAARVATTAENLARLTGQLLAIARGVHSEPRPTSVRGVVEDNLPLLHGLVGTRFGIDVHIADSPALVHADRAQLDQILLNLAQNACEAMERSGSLRITVDTVRRTEPFVCERTGKHPAGDYVRLLVEDTGHGIDEATRRRVFEPYFSTKSDGSGLGLAAVLGIVRRHQGAIALESALGRGTRVEVLFPPCDEPPVEAPLPAEATGEPATIQRVLIVDDHDMVREVAAELLTMLGCEVAQAASGEEALSIYRAREVPYDLVLLDVSMPGMTGVEAHEELARIDPDVRVVLSSGHAELLVRQEVERGLRIAGFLQKPYTLERLREALDLAMRA
jgi:PAS domain S-box-containing protein